MISHYFAPFSIAEKQAIETTLAAALLFVIWTTDCVDRLIEAVRTIPHTIAKARLARRANRLLRSAEKEIRAIEILGLPYCIDFRLARLESRLYRDSMKIKTIEESLDRIHFLLVLLSLDEKLLKQSFYPEKRRLLQIRHELERML